MYTPVSPEKAVEIIRSGHHVYIHTAAAAPQKLVDAMVGKADELKNVSIYHLHTDCDASYTDEKYEGIFEINSLFIGGNVRKATWTGRANYIPAFLSEVPGLFRKGIIHLDVALIQVSPPDRHGFCSLGVSVDATKAAIDVAKYVIAQVNPNMPRTHGDGLIHTKEIDAFVDSDDPIYEHHLPEPGEVEKAIGQHVAGLIEDGSCLQMGIGVIPNAVLQNLTNHKDLGIHTEMFSDGILPLVEKGVITNEKKRVHPGKIISGFAFGTRKLYDFMHDNPLVNMLDIAYVNDISTIRKNKRVVAINSAIEVDLTGQVCADSIGTRFYSGVGGQMDFIRGASLSEGGKPIIALPSVTAKGESKIVPILKPGAGVVTTRAHVHYIATEYGVANLYGKSIKDRIRALINIAHPDHREDIERQAKDYYHL
ncbi:MAG: 4-hydroxybutyrate CoA-transferase [Bacteroidota bacterium]|nr:4-hydroxybutyrate CoA-transferase [Bacteroidota bacterium]MDX5447217.1 4-hydroxybutyrate CoA-transferase [Bacteroidota bacterium]MDX5506079.1 4-hydroxybutyrate CoA-transferase [Bacteroidota bacterium]